MEELIQAVHELGSPGFWDILDTVASAALSGIAVFLTIHIARKEDKTALLDRRYDCFMMIRYMKYLVAELDSSLKSGHTSDSTAIRSDFWLQFDLLARFLFGQDSSFIRKRSECAPDLQKKTQISLSAAGAQNAFLEGIQHVQHYELVSASDILYTTEYELQERDFSLHILSVKDKLEQISLLFPKVDSQCLATLITACEEYLRALSAAYRTYEASLWCTPEACLRSIIATDPVSLDNSCETYRDAYYMYRYHKAGHSDSFVEIKLQTLASDCQEAFRPLADKAADLQNKRTAFLEAYRAFQQTQLPEMEKLVRL